MAPGGRSRKDAGKSKAAGPAYDPQRFDSFLTLNP